MNLVQIRFASLLTLALTGAACSSEDGGSPNQGSGGGAGANSGGAKSTGGTGTSGGASSGGVSAGGGPGSGGESSGGATTSGGTASGGTSSGGSGGGAGGSIADCPAPPAGASPASVTALNAVNTLRVAMGIPCMELVPELNVSAQLHCDYYAANLGNDACIGNAHGEVEGCTGYVGNGIGDRMAAAGYMGKGGLSEVMAFENDPEAAIEMWINSAFHRTPLLSPWYRHMGYGGAEECDTIDLGRGPETPDDVTAIYPYPGQTGLPTAFRGDREGPTPRTPVTTNEWPSSTPIHIYAQDYQIATYQILVDGQTTPLPTTLANDDYDDLIQNPFIFYADEPFASQTTYRVQVSGSQGGTPLAFDWTFTTE